MKQSCVSAFARVARGFALAAVALGFGASALLAQAAGKIEGRVRDQAGAPIANAQVVIVGTAFSALTNPQGYYFINNVPAGQIEVRAAFIGYRAVRAEGVRVLAGQTVTQDFALQATTVQLEDIAVQTTAPLVPRDEVTTKQRIDGAFTDKLPVDRISQVLALQPGVVANSTGTGLSIRGGRTDEHVTYVDGVPITPGNRGTGNGGGNEIGISPGSFEEASVTTGASSAEFGNAQAGVINIVTKTGSATTFTGNLGWETDEPFGKKMSTGFNRLQASFGGPLGMRGLTFSVGGGINGERYSYGGRGSENYPGFVRAGTDTVVAVPSTPGSPSADTTEMTVYNLAVARGTCERFAGSANPDIANNYGLGCQGTRNPRAATSGYQFQGKLNYSYGSGSRMAFLVLASQGQSRNGINFNTNPSNIFGDRNWNRIYQVNWTQNLARSAERALAFDVSVSYQQDRRIAGPLTPEGELDTRNKFGGFLFAPLDFLFDFESFPLDSTLIANYRENDPTSRRSPYDLQNTSQYQAVNKFRDSPYAVLGATESGGPTAGITLFRENRLVGKAAMDWQFDRYNRLRFGGEYTSYESDFYNHGLTSQAFSNAYMEEPRRWSGFLEDRLDLGDVVLVGGVRYDAYETRAARPFALDTIQSLAGAANPFYGTYQPFPRISSYTDADGTYTCPVTTGSCVAGTALDLTAFIEDERRQYLSPHVQVAFPVTEKTNFRLSYAHQVQTPDFGLLLNGINTDLAITNTNHVYGSDLDFGKSITFEFGIRHAFSDDMVLDIAAYNKDKLADAAGRLVSRRDPTRANASVDIRTMTNADFGNSRGIDLRLDRRIGSLFNGTVSYSYSSAKNTGTDPFTYINFGSRVVNAVSGGNQPPPQAITPTSNSRPHSLAGALSVNFPGDWNEGSTMGTLLQNVGLFATFRYASGTAYTKCTDAGNESVQSGEVCIRGGFQGGLNTARLPTFKQFDLKLTKGFGLGGLDLTAYLDARNVLNFKNVLSVFVETDDVVSERERLRIVNGDLIDFADEAGENGILLDNGDIDLTFEGEGNQGCANYVLTNGEGAALNCIYLIRAEQRWGDGDGILTVEEQTTLSEENYLATFDGGRGIDSFTGPGRRMRLGLEINF